MRGVVIISSSLSSSKSGCRTSCIRELSVLKPYRAEGRTGRLTAAPSPLAALLQAAHRLWLRSHHPCERLHTTRWWRETFLVQWRESLPDEVDDGGPAGATAAVGKGAMNKQRMVEGGITRLQRHSDRASKRIVLRGSEGLGYGEHVTGEACATAFNTEKCFGSRGGTCNGEHARGAVFAGAPLVAAGYILRAGRGGGVMHDMWCANTK
jgi:hypothetical protein